MKTATGSSFICHFYKNLKRVENPRKNNLYFKILGDPIYGDLFEEEEFACEVKTGTMYSIDRRLVTEPRKSDLASRKNTVNRVD